MFIVDSLKWRDFVVVNVNNMQKKYLQLYLFLRILPLYLSSSYNQPARK